MFFFRYIHRVFLSEYFYYPLFGHFKPFLPYKFPKIFKRFSLHDKKFSHICIYIFFLDISWDYRDAYKYLNFLFLLVLFDICGLLGIRAVQMYLYIILKNVYGLENNINMF